MSTRTTAKAQDAGPLVVCCARAEGPAIRSALAEMEALGHTLELVEGVEADPKLLAPVIERLRGDGLYVLCRSKLLGRDTVEQLREILLTHHVPFGRTVTVASQRPRDLLERIKASVARAGTRRSGSGPEPAAEAPRAIPARAPVREPSSPRPDAPAMPPLSRATLMATPAAIARSRTQQGRAKSPREVAFEEAITGAQPVVPPHMAAVRDADANDEAPEAADDFDPPTIELPDARDRRAAGGATDPELAAISLTDAAIEVDDDDVDGLHDIDSSLAGASLASVDFSDLERVDSARIALHGLAAPVRTGNTSVAPAPEPPRREPSIPGPPVPPSSRPAEITVVGPAPAPGPAASTSTMKVPAVPRAAATGSTMHVAPAGIAAPHSASIESPSVSGPFSGLGSVSTPAGAAASADLDLDVEPAPRRGLVWALALLGVAVVGLGVVAVVKSGGDDDASGEVASASPGESGKDATKKDAPQDVDDAAPSDAAPSDAAPDAASDPVATPEPDPVLAVVGSALAQRKVRALDILLVQAASAGPMTHGDAQAYCETLDLAGLHGWRLPEVGELYSLAEAGMVGPAVYWSHTAGDTFGDVHLAWHGKRRRVQHESGPSRVLCVHGEPAAP